MRHRPPPALGDGFVAPAVQWLYWLDTTILPTGDAEDHRAVVVLAVPPTPAGTVTVVSRSGTDRFGVVHPADEGLGFSADGWFSRRHPVQRSLWTSAATSPIGRLDDATFAAVRARFPP